MRRWQAVFGVVAAALVVVAGSLAEAQEAPATPLAPERAASPESPVRPGEPEDPGSPRRPGATPTPTSTAAPSLPDTGGYPVALPLSGLTLVLAGWALSLVPRRRRGPGAPEPWTASDAGDDELIGW